MNKVVAEINDDVQDKLPATSAEAQHNEQVLGLWRCDQQAMLGLEFYTDSVPPKILFLEGGVLNMFYLPHLDLKNKNVTEKANRPATSSTFILIKIAQILFT